MSGDVARKTKRVTRRSIPVLVPRETGKKVGISCPVDKPSSTTAAGSASGDGKTTKTKPASSDKNISIFRERTDDHPKARPPLSLQGPFNPNIVGHRKTDDSKRKRNTTPRSNDGSASEKSSHAQLPSTELFSNIKMEHEDHKPKRNPTQDKKRCSIEFQLKPDTNFGENMDKSVMFTAAGKSVKHVSKHVSSRYMDPRKSERQLREKLQNLELEKGQLMEDYKKSISDLEKQLHRKEVEKDKLNAEKSSLQEVLKEKDTASNAAIEEKTKSLSVQNETLQERLDTCHKKLEELNVDPVNLIALHSLSESDLVLRRKEAADEAAALREELAQMNTRNREIIASLRSEEVNEIEPLEESPASDVSEAQKP